MRTRASATWVSKQQERARGMKSLHPTLNNFILLLLLLSITSEAASISNGLYSISYAKNTGYDSSCKEYFLGYEKAGESRPPNLLGFPILLSKGTFNPPLWQLKTAAGKINEFTLTAVNTTFSKPARLAYDATQCLSDTAILSDRGGIRWKLKNGVLTAVSRTNCTKIPGSYLVLGLSSKSSSDGLCSTGVILNPGTNDIWTLKSNRPPPVTTAIKLYGSQNVFNDNFGQSIGMQGNVIGVGGHKEAYLFTRPSVLSRVWSRASLVRPSSIPSTSNFGASVAVDGNIVLVGAPGASSSSSAAAGFAVLYVLNSNGQVDSAVAPLVISGAVYNAKATFGTRVAISGSAVVVSSPGDNAIYVYTYQDDGKISLPKVISGNSDKEENFGRLLALSGNTLAIASSSKVSDLSGSVHIYAKTEGSSFWALQTKLSCRVAADDTAGRAACPSLADFPNTNIALYDQTLAVAHAGTVTMYDRIQSEGKDAGWNQKEQFSAASAKFGSSLALDKGTLLAGEAAKVLAYGRSADFPDGGWEKRAEITAPVNSGAVGFGTSGAAVFEDAVVVGAQGSAKNNGMAFIYRNPTMEYITG